MMLPFVYGEIQIMNMKKQTLRAGLLRRSPKISPAADPLPANLAKFNQLEMVTIYFYLQTEFGEYRCTQFRVIVVTDPPTHKHTNKQTHR